MAKGGLDAPPPPPIGFSNFCRKCELEKTWINRLQTYEELNYYNDYILNRGCPHKLKAK